MLIRNILCFSLIILITSAFCQISVKKLTRNVCNNSENEIAPFASMDGNFLIYTRKRALDDGWKVQLSKKENGKWQRPQPIKVLNELPKLRLLGSYSLNGDGTKLLFVSKRYGGLGNYDIWSSNYSNGEWSKPVNLAKPINSKLEEVNPIYSIDERYIYFTRRESGNKNGKICFSSKKGSLWSNPKEMAINGDYFAIRFAADNETAFLSKIVGDGTHFYVTRKKGNSWSDPIKIEGIDSNSDNYFGVNASSNRLILSSKKEQTYDLYYQTLSPEYASKNVTRLKINLDFPFIADLRKVHDPSFRKKFSSKKETFITNDDSYVIQVLSQDHLPFIKEIDLVDKRSNQKVIRPKLTEIKSGLVEVSPCFLPERTIINAKLMSYELNALNKIAKAHPDKVFNVITFKKNVTTDSSETASHFIEKMDSIEVVSDKPIDESTSIDATLAASKMYTNDYTSAWTQALQDLNIPMSANVVFKKASEFSPVINSLKEDEGLAIYITDNE